MVWDCLVLAGGDEPGGGWDFFVSYTQADRRGPHAVPDEPHFPVRWHAYGKSRSQLALHRAGPELDQLARDLAAGSG
jgi:hypothetical protein